MKPYLVAVLAGLAAGLTSNASLAHGETTRPHLHLFDGVIDLLPLLSIPLLLAVGWVLRRWRTKRRNGGL